MRRNHGIIGERQIMTTAGANGIHDIFDAHLARAQNKWPRTAGFTLTSDLSTMTEGQTVTFTLSTEHVADGTTFYYTISTVSGTTMVDADFTPSGSPGGQGVDGSFTTTNNSTTLAFELYADGISESNVFKLQIRSGSTSGTIIIESANVTVTDAAAGVDLVNAFHEISNRYIVDTTTQDYTGNLDVSETIVAPTVTGNRRIYLVFKCTTQTTYYNDICVAIVRVLRDYQYPWQPAGTYATAYDFNFGRDGGPGSAYANNWEFAARVNANNSSLLSSYLTPAQAAAYSYSSIGTSPSNTNVALYSSTGSHYTGIANGVRVVGATYWSPPTLTVGNGTTAQNTMYTNVYFIYGEVSGAARYSHVVARSPQLYSFNGTEKIQVCHAVVIPNSQTSSININDSLWLGMQ